MRKKILFACLAALFLLPSSAVAWTWTPLQLSVWDPIQLFPERYNVYGIRMNLAYGSNQNLTGIDLGGVNVVSRNQGGIQAGLINLSESSAGLCAGVMNYTTRLGGGQLGLLNTAQDSMTGIQATGLMNLSDHVKGAQVHCGILGNGAVTVAGAQFVLLAGYNLTENINGLQLAMFGFNYASGSVNGVQFAMLYNYAKNLNGLQLSLVNACETLSGVQVGLVNIIWQEKMSMMPLLNFRF